MQAICTQSNSKTYPNYFFLIEIDRRLNLFFDRIRRIQMFIEKQIKKIFDPAGVVLTNGIFNAINMQSLRD